MSTRTLTCVVLDCDGCGGTFEHDYTPHYADAQLAREAGIEVDWSTDGTRDWCPECQTEPHKCSPDPTDPKLCARCREPLTPDTEDPPT